MDDADPPKSTSDSTRTTVGVLVAMVIVLIVAGIGIATIRDANETIRRATAPTTVATPDGAGSVSPSEDLSPEQSRVVEDVKAQVAAIRGLAWKGPLLVKVLTRDQLSTRVRQLTATEVAENQADVDTDESVLKLLQLINRDVDFAKTIDSILAGGVLGYYDDETKELFVGGGSSDGLDAATQVTLAHELTHALTDQHVDFGSRTKALDEPDQTEQAAALGALIEGDAELVAGLWQERHLTERQRREAATSASDGGSAYADAPPYLLESLLFPYQDGLSFVRSLHRAGGFAEVDNAYRNPPTSTEHILHPETYAGGQSWTAPKLPDLAAATGCGSVGRGTLGEFDMGQLLAREISRADARNAADGWNGDAYAVVRCGAALGLADRWQTDDPTDAGPLADALTRWARGWSGSSRAADAQGRVTGPKGSARVVRTGGRVDLVLADDVATADRVASALLAG